MSDVIVPAGKPIKLVVWDLDDVLWRAAAGVDRAPALPAGIGALIATLDARGILMAGVTQRGAEATDALHRLGVRPYLLSVESGPRADAIVQIADAWNLALDATLVLGGAADPLACMPPGVRIVTGDADPLARLADDPLLGAGAALEPRPRRLIYLEERARVAAERGFAGSRDAFFSGLGMQLRLAPATPAELPRVRELVTRTNQLGVTYDDDALAALIASPRHACWLVSLADRFGDCGQVGLVVVERAATRWTLQLLQCSCRALPRGIDAIALHAVMRQARAAGVALVAAVRPTRKNEALRAAYDRAGFVAAGEDGDVVLLTHDLVDVPAAPPGVAVRFAPRTEHGS